MLIVCLLFLMISDVVAGMFMVELQFYTRHAETVFTAARAVSKKSGPTDLT